MKEDQLKKLPQWAQREIRYLKGDIEDLKLEIAQLKNAVKDSDFVIQFPGKFKQEDMIGVQRDAAVRAYIYDEVGALTEAYVEMQRCDGRIEIMTQGGDMIISPRCGNVFEVSVIQHD